MPKKKSHEPDKFPAGNAKIGDEVLIVTWRNRAARMIDAAAWKAEQMKIRLATVAKVGWLNEFGHHLDIVVKMKNGHRHQLPSTRTHLFTTGDDKPTKQNPVVLCIPPYEELTAEIKLWRERQKLPVVITRHPSNTDEIYYDFRCGSCLGDLTYYVDYVEAQEFRFWTDRFSLGKPEIVDGNGERLRCEHCDAAYEMPEEYDSYT